MNAPPSSTLQRLAHIERQVDAIDLPMGRWARIQVFPDADAHGVVESVFTIAFDIHQDVMEREALAAARQRLTHFTENIPYPLTYVDHHFVLQFVNKAYIEATGQPPTQMVGRPIGNVRRQALGRAQDLFRARA